MSNWGATWFALTRHGAIGEVGSLERFLIFFNALRLLWVMLGDVMTSSHLFFFHVVHKCITVVKRVACILFRLLFIHDL